MIKKLNKTSESIESKIHLEDNFDIYENAVYLEEYKANIQIFKSIPTLDLGNIILRGVYPSKLDIEVEMYFHISKREEVKQYLPEAYVVSKERAKDKIFEFIQRMLLNRCLFFCIAEKATKIPLGYVICHSPLVTYKNSNEQIGDWTIDFWLGKDFEGKGIMGKSLIGILTYLQKMEVPFVFAFVEKRNYKSIKVLEQCQFLRIASTNDNKNWKYGIKLN